MDHHNRVTLLKDMDLPPSRVTGLLNKGGDRHLDNNSILEDHLPPKATQHLNSKDMGDNHLHNKALLSLSGSSQDMVLYSRLMGFRRQSQVLGHHKVVS